MRGGKFFLYSLFFLILFFMRFLYADNNYKPYSLMGMLNFATSLYKEGDYYRAITEYKRVLFFYPTYAKKSEVLFMIGKSYFRGKKYEQAITYLSSSHSVNNKKISFERDILLMLSYYHTKNYALVIDEITDIKKKYTVSYEFLDVIAGVSYASLGDFGMAKKIFDDLYVDTKDNDKKEFFKEFSKLLDKANSYSYKSPLFSGILSAIFPGLGYIYCGRYVDGIISFLLVGLSSFVAYDGYRHNSWVQFGVFSILAISFYGGNIYGSVRRAIKDNYLVAKDELDKINIKLYEYEIFFLKRF
jgi:tetratricopeptide (TPR) repeat protein